MVLIVFCVFSRWISKGGAEIKEESLKVNKKGWRGGVNFLEKQNSKEYIDFQTKNKEVVRYFIFRFDFILFSYAL